MKEQEPKEITVKFGKKVTENIITATRLVDHFQEEYKKADVSRISLVESVVLSISGLESLDGYKVNVNPDKGGAVLIKE